LGNVHYVIIGVEFFEITEIDLKLLLFV